LFFFVLLFLRGKLQEKNAAILGYPQDFWLVVVVFAGKNVG
jgi:hypothetical protein